MSPWLVGSLIFLCAVAFGVLGVLAVTFVEYLGDRDRGRFRRMRPSRPFKGYIRANWKPLLGGICTGVLAAGSAAELAFSGFRDDAEHHAILTTVLTGALLAVITVLVIEALVRSVATRAWEGSLTGTWHLAVRGGRRGAAELRRHLLTNGEACVTQDCLPDPGSPHAKQAHTAARELWFDLGDRVSRASLAAFACDQPDLGESMHKLSAATDTLHQALMRYSADAPSESKGRRYEKDDIVDYWRQYVSVLLEVDEKGRSELTNYTSPVPDAQRQWLKVEAGGIVSATLSKT